MIVFINQLQCTGLNAKCCIFQCVFTILRRFKLITHKIKTIDSTPRTIFINTWRVKQTTPDCTFLTHFKAFAFSTSCIFPSSSFFLLFIQKLFFFLSRKTLTWIGIVTDIGVVFNFLFVIRSVISRLWWFNGDFSFNWQRKCIQSWM